MTIRNFQSETKPQTSKNIREELDVEGNECFITSSCLTQTGDTTLPPGKRKPSLVKALNQGLATLGERLCK